MIIYDKIKSMGIAEMAKWLKEQYSFCDYDRCSDNCKYCKVNNLEEWLLSEEEQAE